MTLAPARRDTGNTANAASYDALITAAHNLIARDGYHAVTVDEIRLEAGVSRATFYFYFRNKLQVFLHAANRVMDDLGRIRHEAEAERERDAYSGIRHANRVHFLAWASEGRILGQLYALSLVEDEAREVWKARRERFERRTRGDLQRLLDKGRIPPLDVDLTTTILAGMAEAFCQRFFAPDAPRFPTEEELQAAVEAMSQVWYRTIYGTVPPRTVGAVPPPAAAPGA